MIGSKASMVHLDAYSRPSQLSMMTVELGNISARVASTGPPTCQHAQRPLSETVGS